MALNQMSNESRPVFAKAALNMRVVDTAQKTASESFSCKSLIQHNFDKTQTRLMIY